MAEQPDHRQQGDQEKEVFQKESIPMTKGELIQAIGVEEAERNIARGKYDIVYDSDDEPQYVKKRRTYIEAVEKSVSAASSKRSVREHPHITHPFFV